MFNSEDHKQMARAIQLAERGLFTTDPNPRVGCVLVRDGEVVGEGWHQIAGGHHAEINALNQAAERARGATAYVTLEPCCHHGKTPPCSEALIAAGVSRVVVAMEDPNPRVAGEGLKQLAAAGIDVASGVMEAQARALNPGFIKRMQSGRPFVRCKLAMSLDGRTAMASGESKWITGEAARIDVHHMRARSSAIITGIGTVLADDPSLDVRLPAHEGEIHQPLRVVLDPHLSTPVNARMFGLPGRKLIVTASDEEEVREQLDRDDVEVVYMPNGHNSIDLHALLDLLGELEINEILLETGATLSGAVLRAGLIDEIVVYMAPKLMGHDARGLFRLPGLDSMEQAIDLDITDVRAVGRDWRITAKLANPVT
jgi:diaminohydroxyphosphoribosylaminopyrimidine deaminase/5-amino-6-(5-phosphoribosylamino)uracil reductase